jgi:hypothetical protein
MGGLVFVVIVVGMRNIWDDIFLGDYSILKVESAKANAVREQKLDGFFHERCDFDVNMS